jgi:hypothetical protein
VKLAQVSVSARRDFSDLHCRCLAAPSAKYLSLASDDQSSKPGG